ncbi:hypothetical protein ACIO6U_13375 [Streptomyces sp. NPDC087422]|uniref:hypothetical protein n=1 Tax=Streptomyces sp. NPDC087422 TaxID=3365786 RepID=UPI0038294D12
MLLHAATRSRIVGSGGDPVSLLVGGRTSQVAPSRIPMTGWRSSFEPIVLPRVPVGGNSLMARPPWCRGAVRALAVTAAARVGDRAELHCRQTQLAVPAVTACVTVGEDGDDGDAGVAPGALATVRAVVAGVADSDHGVPVDADGVERPAERVRHEVAAAVVIEALPAVEDEAERSRPW